jgi:hypothetical protein
VTTGHAEGRREVLPTLIRLDCEPAASAPLGCAAGSRRVDARDHRLTAKGLAFFPAPAFIAE